VSDVGRFLPFPKRIEYRELLDLEKPPRRSFGYECILAIKYISNSKTAIVMTMSIAIGKSNPALLSCRQASMRNVATTAIVSPRGPKPKLPITTIRTAKPTETPTREAVFEGPIGLTMSPTIVRRNISMSPDADHLELKRPEKSREGSNFGEDGVPT
jgi:hypothetical protein